MPSSSLLDSDSSEKPVRPPPIGCSFTSFKLDKTPLQRMAATGYYQILQCRMTDTPEHGIEAAEHARLQLGLHSLSWLTPPC